MLLQGQAERTLGGRDGLLRQKKKQGLREKEEERIPSALARRSKELTLNGGGGTRGIGPFGQRKGQEGTSHDQRKGEDPSKKASRQKAIWPPWNDDNHKIP